MALSQECICILSGNRETADKLKEELGCINGSLELVTKYYSAKIPVVIVSSSNQISEQTGAIIVLADMASKISDLKMDDHVVSIVYADDETLLDHCIDHRFELVQISGNGDDCGVARVKEAIKCRMWSLASVKTPAEDEKILESLDDLMSRIKSVRDSVTDDSSRKKMAESLAFELAALLGSDSEDSTS